MPNVPLDVLDKLRDQVKEANLSDEVMRQQIKALKNEVRAKDEAIKAFINTEVELRRELDKRDEEIKIMSEQIHVSDGEYRKAWDELIKARTTIKQLKGGN